jgi:hypothetical protein
MYTGSFPAVATSEDWIVQITVIDEETDAPFNLTGVLFALAIEGEGRSTPDITGSIADGKVIIVSAVNGEMSILVPQSEIGRLTPGDYDVGLRLETADGTRKQLIIATLPIVDGVVE